MINGFFRVLLGALLMAGGMTLPMAQVARAQDSGLAIGTTAPSATLQTLDGKTVDLAQVAKGPAVIEFWATW
ncbi:MAG: TlpA family protein disulfide reductase, partial [bacterium]